MYIISPICVQHDRCQAPGVLGLCTLLNINILRFQTTFMSFGGLGPWPKDFVHRADIK